MTKKVVYISIAVLTVFAFATVVSVLLTDEMNHMSKDKAQNIVTGRDKYAGTVKKVTRGVKDDKFIYKVKVDDTKKGDIVVGVDAHSGDIVGDTGMHISRKKARKIAKHKYGGEFPGSKSAATHNGKTNWRVELDDTYQGDIVVAVDAYRGKISAIAKKSSNYEYTGDGKYENEIRQVLDYVNLNESPKGGVLTRDRAKIWVYKGVGATAGDTIRIKYRDSDGKKTEQTYEKGSLDYFSPDHSASGSSTTVKPDYTENVG